MSKRHNSMATNFGIIYGRKKDTLVSERKYNLTVTESQLGVIVDALDLFTRVGIGQFEEVIRVYDPLRKMGDSWEAIEVLLLAAKEEAGHPRSGSHGIHNEKVRDTFRTSFDLKQVIQNRLAWDRNPEGSKIQVQFDTPSQTNDNVPLATISEIK